MRKNVLIFSGGAYPGIQIYYCLQHNKLFHPIAASSYSDHSRFVFMDYVDDLPYVYEKNFITDLNRLIKEKNISFIIPTHDTIALFLMEHQNEINATVVCSPYETTLLCRYKSKTYEHLKDHSFTPRVYQNIDEAAKYPLFAKPDDGQGAQGAVVVRTKKELQSIFATERAMVVCEYLSGEEITVDCFTNGKRELLFINPRRRSRIMYGVSARSEKMELTDEIRRIVQEINEDIVFRGYWFVQLKKDQTGHYKLLEICTRFSGTFGLSKSLDVNLPLLALCDFDGMDVSVTPNHYEICCDKSFIDRYEMKIHYNRVYIDYDDTVTCADGAGVNPLILAYLYQCRAKKIRIVLITKHTGSVADDMKRFAVAPEIFDEIIELTHEQSKTAAMDDKTPSIFIDNSYAERAEVKKAFHMPTFDVSNIDCLLDWR